MLQATAEDDLEDHDGAESHDVAAASSSSEPRDPSPLAVEVCSQPPPAFVDACPAAVGALEDAAEDVCAGAVRRGEPFTHAFFPSIRNHDRCREALVLAGKDFDAEVRHFLRVYVIQCFGDWTCQRSFLDEREECAKLSLDELLQLARGADPSPDAVRRARAIRTLLGHFPWFLRERADYHERQQASLESYWY